MKRFCVTALMAVFLGAASLQAQSFSHHVSLSGLGNGNSAKAFGLAADETNHRLYVAVCGDFSGSNNVIAEIDTLTDSVVRTITVGNYPEDIALLAGPNSSGLSTGAVTNSSDGTVSVWDLASGNPIAVVQLPDPFMMGSCYPFGIAAGGPGLMITTVDGSGDVHAIDTTTWTHDPAASFNLGWKSLGRPLASGNEIIVPTTAFTPSWTGAEAGISAFANGAALVSWSHKLAVNDGNNIFPSGNDVVELADGTLLMSGMDLDGRLYQLSANGEILRTMRLQNGAGAHGIALSADGSLLVACDLAYGWVTFIDLLNWVELVAFQTASTGLGYMMPNDAAFCDGKVYVTCQGSEEVMVFDNLPTLVPGGAYQGLITVDDSTPNVGDTLTVQVSGTGVVALFVSFEDSAGTYSGIDLQLGSAPRLVGWSGNGSYSRTWTIPANAPSGFNLFTQGIVDIKGTPAPTAPRCAVIQ